jgi:hypothetical protein
MATAVRAVGGPRAARREFWRRQVDAHRRSGLSRAAFCARRDLRTGTLSFWKWKFAREARPAPRRGATKGRRSTAAPRFIPIQVAALQAPRRAAPTPAPLDHLEIKITVGPGRGLRVRGQVEPAWVVQVLRGLEAPRC